MDLYLSEYSPRSSTVGSYFDIYDLVKTRRSLSDGKNNCTVSFVTLAIVLSTLIKVYSLIVFFARVQVQVLLVSPDKAHDDSEHKMELFSMFITDFSFAQMVQDFWMAKAYLMSSIIVVGSATIPLAKHLYMLCAWLVPISTEWYPARRRLLFFFDQTGRTALADLFLGGYVICIFYTRVVQSVGGYGFEIFLTGEPVRGLFCGIVSTFTGSFLSHYLLLTHDVQSMGEFDQQVTVAAGPAVASLMQRLEASNMSRGYKNMANTIVGLLVIGSALSLGFLAFEGFEITAFKMEGLAGSISNATWRNFNLVTAPLNMPKNSNEILGTRILSLLHIALVLAVPLGLLISATVLWFVPLHLKPQRRFLSLFPFWNSWCALDVFLLTSFASYLEMHLIARFIFDKQFQTLCNGLEVLKLSCVELGHEVGPGMYILVGCTGLFLMLSFVLAKVGNVLLETASMTAQDSVQFTPGNWDDVVSISPLISRMGSNDFVVLSTGNGAVSGSTAPGAAVSAKKPQPNISYW